MKRLFIYSIVLAFILLNLTWFYSVKRPCYSGSLSVIQFPTSCHPGQSYYTISGFPIEFYWSNSTGFIFIWYLIDYTLFLLISFLILNALIFIKSKVHPTGVLKSQSH